MVYNTKTHWLHLFYCWLLPIVFWNWMPENIHWHNGYTYLTLIHCVLSSGLFIILGSKQRKLHLTTIELKQPNFLLNRQWCVDLLFELFIDIIWGKFLLKYFPYNVFKIFIKIYNCFEISCKCMDKLNRTDSVQLTFVVCRTDTWLIRINHVSVWDNDEH